MFSLAPLLFWFYVIMLYLGILGTRANADYIVDETGGKYDVRIVCVEYHIQNYAYATVPGKGERAEYVSGLTPEVTFSIRNMSDKARLIPIPENFYITTDFYDKHRPKGVLYNNKCKCYLSDYAGAPLIPDGVGYKSVYDVPHATIGNKAALLFGPQEEKKFTVPFPKNIFPENEETFKFCGFSQYDKFSRKNVDVVYEIGVADKKLKKAYVLR